MVNVADRCPSALLRKLPLALEIMSASRVCGLLVPATLLSDSATEEDEDEAEILPFGGGVCEYRAIRPRTEDRLAILLMLLVRLALGLGKVKEEVVTNGDDKDGVGFN